MELQIVSLETAKLAKELGFDWNCYHCYDQDYTGNVELQTAGDIIDSVQFSKEDIECAEGNGYNSYLAPEQELLRKWLRDVYNVHLYNQCNFYNKNAFLGYIPCIDIFNENQIHIESIDEDWFRKLGQYDTPLKVSFEEATEMALQRALNYLKEKQNNNDKTK